MKKLEKRTNKVIYKPDERKNVGQVNWQSLSSFQKMPKMLIITNPAICTICAVVTSMAMERGTRMPMAVTV